MEAVLVELTTPILAVYRETTSLGPLTIAQSTDRVALEQRGKVTHVAFETEAQPKTIFRPAELLPTRIYERQLNRLADGLRLRLDDLSS